MKRNQENKGLKNLRNLSALIFLISLMSLTPLQAQFEGIAPPSSKASSEGRTPFSNESPAATKLRAIGGGGGGFGGETGAEDDPANVNDNNVPIGDMQWLLPLLAIGYGIYNRKTQHATRTRNM